MKKLLTLLSIILLSSCVSYLKQNKSIHSVIDSNRGTIKNVDKRDAQKALIQVFRLAKDDFSTSISANENNVYIKTQQNPYWLLGFSRIMTNLTFNLSENNGDIYLNINHKDNTFKNIFGIINDYEETIVISPALNDLVIKRTNYLLGKADRWYTCSEYETYAKDNNIKGSIDAICWFASDIIPTSSKGKDILKSSDI